MNNKFTLKKSFTIENAEDLKKAILMKHGNLTKASIFYEKTVPSLKYQSLLSILSPRQKATNEQIEVISNDLKISKKIVEIVCNNN